MTRRTVERHGHAAANSPEYRVWTQMLVRCHNPRSANYRLYGGRGIFVCDEWRSSFVAFLSSVGARPLGTTLDRIDNSKGYEPLNVRWATPRDQAVNRSSTRLVTIDGITRCATDWARLAGVSDTCILYRLRKGLSGQALLREGRHGKALTAASEAAQRRDPTYFALAAERLRAEEQGTTLPAARAGQTPLFGSVA